VVAAGFSLRDKDFAQYITRAKARDYQELDELCSRAMFMAHYF